MQRNCLRKYFECPDETLWLARSGEIIYKYKTEIHSFESTHVQRCIGLHAYMIQILYMIFVMF